MEKKPYYQDLITKNMIKTHFLIAWRSLSRNKLASIINISGLSIAIGIAIVVFIFVDGSYRKEDFHEHADRIFMLENEINRSGQLELWGDSPFPLGPLLEQDYPQIERAVRILYRGAKVEAGDKVFQDRIQFVDEGFLDMFTFPLKMGNKDALLDPNAVILGERVAKKYFGDENPLGKQISLTLSDTLTRSFVVKGVAVEEPSRASFGVRLLVRFDVLEDFGYDVKSWKRWVSATFVQLRNPDDMPALAEGQEKYLSIQNAANPSWAIQSLHLVNLLDVPFQGENLRNAIIGRQPVEATLIFSMISVFLLMLACFNYINIAIGTAARRLKEIGIRKVIGSSRRQIIMQFLGENLLLCFFALLLGVLLAHYFFLPGFNYALNFDGEPIEMGYGENPFLWLFLIGILLLTAVGAGIYPALVVSAFKVVSIFRGELKLMGKDRLTKVLLTFQFFLAFMLLVAGVVFTQNSRFQRNKDWGYNQSQTLVLPVENSGEYRALHDALQQQAAVQYLAGADNHIGKGTRISVIQYQGDSYEINQIKAGFGYAEAMGLRLSEGRFFDPDIQTDATEAVLINQTFARNMGWEESLGQQIQKDTLSFTVVGVVEDFHYQEFFEAIEPLVIFITPEDHFTYLVARSYPGQTVQLKDRAEEAWSALIPDRSYDGYFQDTVFDRFFRVSQGITDIFVTVSIMALLLSCMGLFGLISLIVTRRMKEFSIRKVMGASVLHLVSLVNRQFVWLLLIAALIATPLSYFLWKGLLDSVFPDSHISIGVFPFVAVGIVILGTSVLTISGHLLKVARANPVDALRDE